jgi:hypothetical protein
MLAAPPDTPTRNVSGALYHAILRRDGVFERMLPWRRAARPASAINPARQPPG